jgi:uroporphyrinogen-III synthase
VPQLDGFTVGVTADRRNDDQAVMFARLGAEVLQAPTLHTVKIPDAAALRARTEEIVSDPPDYLIANTGVGMRTWLAAAVDWGLDTALLDALRRVPIAVRGPKAAAALSSVGLSSWWRSPNEQLSELVDHLIDEGVAGSRVAFQLHGDDGAEVVARLGAEGARVATVPVYVWEPPTDPGPAHELIVRCCAGTVDAVTFTAGPQVRSLLELADSAGCRDDLVRALAGPRIVVGCVGPVCAGVAEECGIPSPVVPPNWRLGSLVKAVAAALEARIPHPG